MVRLAIGALCVWVCVLHSTEAVPTPIADAVSLAALDATPAEQVAAAKAKVADVASGVSTAASSSSSSSSASLTSVDQNPLAQIVPAKDGSLKPGQKGFLTQMINGKPKSFKETMAAINNKISKKEIKDRRGAYDHHHAAHLARLASDAVADMAQEVGREADENAEQKAADYSDCVLRLGSATDPNERLSLQKECLESKKAKNMAYEEAANAVSASSKAVESAGENEGAVIADANLNTDATQELLNAQKEALGAKMHLEAYDKFSAKTQRQDAALAQVKEAGRQNMARIKKSFADRLARHDANSAARDVSAPARPFRSVKPIIPVAPKSNDRQDELTNAAEAAMKLARSNPSTANTRAAERAMSVARSAAPKL